MSGTSRTNGMGETSISDLRETLQAQQQLLQALYAELDEEREASATSASEALSMILRLQGEKAAVKMEASQYKRMAEEKMCHAETSLAIFEELYSQREMEIANLEYEVETCRCKLSSMGFEDIGTSECKFPENLLLQARDHMHTKETPMGGNTRRLRSVSSLPPFPTKDSAVKKSSIERKKSMSDIISEIVEQSGDQESVSQSLKLVRKSGESGSGTFDSYWNRITQLEEQVKRISDGKEPEGKKNASADGWKFCSFDQASTNETLEQSRQTPTANLNLVNHQSEWGGDSALSSSNCLDVYEVFEVPQAKTDENDKLWEPLKKKHDNFDIESDDRLKKPDNSEKNCELDILYDKNKSKKLHFNTKSACQKDSLTVCEKKPEEIYVGYNSPPTLSSGSSVLEPQDELQKLYQRIKHLEGLRNGGRCEISPSRGDEHLKLLNEIIEQLNAVEFKMRSSHKVKYTPLKDEVSLLPLQEAMLYFWM